MGVEVVCDVEIVGGVGRVYIISGVNCGEDGVCLCSGVKYV